MREKLATLAKLIRAAKTAPLFGKAPLAEQAIETAHALLGEVVERLEAVTEESLSRDRAFLEMVTRLQKLEAKNHG